MLLGVCQRIPVMLLVPVLLDMTYASLHDHNMNQMDMDDYSYHRCKRICSDHEPPQVCEYDFMMESYYTMSKACYNCPFPETDCDRPHCIPADGRSRKILVVNRMMPGPAIHVCQGDKIRVRIHNKMDMSEAVTIHWHGVLQEGTPYMDGVEQVTQCAVLAHTSFTYTFTAANAGTHYWHAHAGFQRGDGLFGHLVIRQPPSKEPHVGQYDHDIPQHSLMLTDWIGRSFSDFYADFHHAFEKSNVPTSILFNGKGRYTVFQNPHTGDNTTTSREVFKVTQGKRYRFRVVGNGILNCPFQVSIDHHMLTIIASDGYPVEPIEVESFTAFPGERYDFVLIADKNISNYLIRVRGMGDCSRLAVKGTAILRYQGAPEDDSMDTPFPVLTGIQLNPANFKESSASQMQVTKLKSLVKDDPTLNRTPDKRFTFALDLTKVNNPNIHHGDFYSVDQIPAATSQGFIFSAQINNIALKLPPVPVLTQYEDIPKDMFCDEDTMKFQNCKERFCECLVVYQVALGDVVEILMVNEGQYLPSDHPMHLHGHGYRVVSMGKLGSSTTVSVVEEMDSSGNITRNLDRPPVKDTVSVPDGGYTIIRFHANNPGMWLMHCHILDHSAVGMGVIFQVGKISQFPSMPRRFPQCGSWDDQLFEEEEDKNENNGSGFLSMSALLVLVVVLSNLLCTVFIQN